MRGVTGRALQTAARTALAAQPFEVASIALARLPLPHCSAINALLSVSISSCRYDNAGNRAP